ncbi:MAG TPA: PQQ-binding-like beta-propeller repeat protein [Planctomycetota bacterium]|nr:PQQ-binding-like beta-propeller repeat protein [Planctomycetota bacterium]
MGSLSQRRFSRLVLIFSISLLSRLHAAEIVESFKELKPEWAVDKGAKSQGSVTASPDGLLIQAEPRQFALVKRDSPAAGSDAAPLSVSIQIRTQHGADGPLQPGLHLYWDDKNYAFMKITGDGHLSFGSSADGNFREQAMWNVAREGKSVENKKWRELYVRMLVVSRNIAFYIGNDGKNWQKVGEAAQRPGAAGKAPKVILGRGWNGEGKDRKPDLANDYYADGNKNLIKTLLTSFQLSDKVEQPGEAPNLVKQDTWEQTLATLDPMGIPRAWSFLGPLSMKNWDRKPQPPDLSDDWSAPKDSAGQPIKAASWVRPDDDSDCYVDFSEHVGQGSLTLGWAKSEIDWPVSGEALLWFSSGDQITLYVNNNPVYMDSDDPHDRRAVKDRSCISVAMNKGKNVIKARIRQSKGDWGFFLRLERNEPGYRIRLLEKMLELFPDTANWRAVNAYFEIARRYEDMGNYHAAIAATDKAMTLFAQDDENRLRAFENKLRLLEFLRDYETLVKTSEAYLAAYPRALGATSALRAILRGEVMAGRPDAALARLKNWQPDASPLRLTDAYRIIAGAFEDSEKNDKLWETLDALAENKAVAASERVRAGIESALRRWETQRRKAHANQPLDNAIVAAGCASAAKALSLVGANAAPLAMKLAQEAEADMKAGKAERAWAGYWGALLLAIGGSGAETAAHLRFGGAPAIEIPAKDKDNKDFIDPGQFRKALWKSVAPAVNEPKWAGKWRFVGFPIEGNTTIRTAFGPETDSNKADYGNGRKWVECDLGAENDFDVYRGNHDWGIDLNPWKGNSQIGYVARDFEVAVGGETTLWLSTIGSWFAWLDGKAVGENTNVNGFRLENDRIKLQLSPGKHRLLLKLEAPVEGPFVFRARIGNEPEMAMHLLVQALTVRQFPRTLWDRRGELQWLMHFTWGKTTPDVPLKIADTISQLYADNSNARIEPMYWILDQLRNTGDQASANDELAGLIKRLEYGGWYSEKKRHVSDLYMRHFFSLVGEGRAAVADGVLRDVCNQYPDMSDAYFQALTLRGCLRRDFGMSQPAQPFFEEVLRGNSMALRNNRSAVLGLEWSRGYRPERLLLDTSHEVQAVLDAIRRQLGAAAADDIEKAMRNISEVLTSAPGALNKVVDSPFYSRYVGVREYIRALLGSLPESNRDVYRKVVEAASKRRLKIATEMNDAAALEVLANEFYFTPAAIAARNRAGNLYLERGQYARAASVFQTLQREVRTGDSPSAALLTAKIARALAADGQTAAAEKALERLKTQYGGEQVTYAGEKISGAALADKLKSAFAALKTAAVADEGGGTQSHMGGLARVGMPKGPSTEPGPIVWAHPLIPSADLERTRGAFELDVRAHLPVYPVVSEGKVFVAGLESVRVIDQASGAILWTRTWPTGQPLFKGFNGYPESCPTVNGSNLYVRTVEGGVSSLRCYAADTGKVRWNTGAVSELKKLVWISDPAITYGLAIAVFVEPGDMNTHGIAALDAETGRIRWKTSLVTGNTGVKLNDQYHLSTLHLGPPAVEGGEIYVNTGLSSVAAVNAFSGEIKWVTTYPKIQFGDKRSGQSHVGYDLRLCTVKALARGPLSPMIVDDLLIIVPKDGSGVLALERQSGAVRWKKEMIDARYIGGICDGNVLLCDDTVTALNVANGSISWQYSLQEQALYGQPALSGKTLYLSGDKELLRIDARTGTLQGATAWDNRVGPLANLVVTPAGLVGIGSGTVAALGLPNAKAVTLPLFEARELESAGKLEAAVERYGSLLGSKESSEVLQALIARTRILQRMGKRDEALATLTKIEQESSELLSSFNGLWQVKKDVFARALRSRLGEKVPEAPNPAGDLSGVLVYSWQLPGEHSRLYYPRVGPQDCVLVHSGSEISCVRIGETPDVLWRSYVGPAISSVQVGLSAVAAVSDFRIVLLDRATGETLTEITPPNLTKKFQRRLETKPFDDVAISESTLVTVGENNLIAWDIPTGQMLWSKRMGWTHRPVQGGLAVANGKIFKVQGVKNEKQNDSGLCTYDLKTGNELESLVLGSRSGAMLSSYSPDAKRVLYRFDNNLICADTTQIKKAWQANPPRLDLRGGPFFFDGNVIRHMGPENGNGRFIVVWMNAETGKELPVNWVFPDGRKEARSRLGGMAFRVNDEYVVFSGDWFRSMSRMKVNGDNVDGIFTVDLPDYLWRDHYVLNAFSGRDRFHVVYVRSRNNQDQFVLRTFTWEGGQLISESILPGTPIRQEDNTFSAAFLQKGNVLLYTSREGVFAFTSNGETAPKVAERLKQELAGETLSAQRRRDARRALANLNAVPTMAFLAPADIRIEGGLNEWQKTEPIVVEGAQQFVPLAENAKWNGREDLSAKLYIGWNQEGLALAVDVADDVMSPPAPGSELTSGDSLRLIVDSRPEYGSSLDRNEDFVGTLALVGSRSLLDQELNVSDDPSEAPQGHVMRAPNGKGYRYEMMIPWALIRKDPSQRPGWQRQFRIGVAVYDDDGSGVKGAIELGSGTTSSSCITTWLSPLTLLDVSHEKIERYRKVIDMVPGSDEAMRFLELILLSKRGVNADNERIAELERFVKTHPNTPNTSRALGLLRPLYQKMSDSPPEARLGEFMKSAKVADAIQQMVTGSAIKMWAYTDPKSPAQMIMLQFQRSDGYWFRAYWGSSAIDWGREGSPERMYMGPIPKAGQWTELVVYPSDFGMLGSEIKNFALTTYAGNTYFDRVSVRVQGQEKVLIDDALFEKGQVSQGRIKFVDNPKHDGAKSFTFERNNAHEVLLNPIIHSSDGKSLVTFVNEAFKGNEQVDREKYQTVCRNVAQLIQDTPEGLTFLQRVLDMHNDEGGKNRNLKCIDELKAFLKANPNTPNAGSILKMLHGWYRNAGEKEPLARCEEMMQEVKVARDVKRAFYSEYSPAWTEWNVLGPFSAQGERRGLDTLMEPERAVDLKWKTVDAAGREIGWTKISNALLKDKKPNPDPIVDLRRHLSIPRTVEQRGPLFAYAYVKFNVPSKRRGLLLFGAKDMVSIWLNGKRIVNELETYDQKDKESVDVNLRSGENEVLIKVGCPRDQRLGFVLRLADTDGKPFTDVINE